MSRRQFTYRVLQEVKPPMRYVYGARQDFSLAAPAGPVAPAPQVAEVPIDSIYQREPGGPVVVALTVPPADHSTIRPTRIFACFAQSPPADGVDALEYLSVPGHVTAVADVPDGDQLEAVNIVVDIPPGDYCVQTVLELDDAS